LGNEWLKWAITSFATDPSIKAKGPVYAAKAKKAFQENFEHVCIENVQACVLIGNICYGDSHADVESLYFGKNPNPNPGGMAALMPDRIQCLPTAWCRFYSLQRQTKQMTQ
jgi:hypothetical protein